VTGGTGTIAPNALSNSSHKPVTLIFGKTTLELPVDIAGNGDKTIVSIFTMQGNRLYRALVFPGQWRVNGGRLEKPTASGELRGQGQHRRRPCSTTGVWHFDSAAVDDCAVTVHEGPKIRSRAPAWGAASSTCYPGIWDSIYDAVLPLWNGISWEKSKYLKYL